MNKIECRSCGKSIDDDSSFCKYCGNHVTNQLTSNNEEKLARIFQGVYNSLYQYSDYSEECEKKFESYKNYDNRIMSDNEYYQVFVDVVFYSGFRASTVDKYLDRIHMRFHDYQIVRNYSLVEIEKIKNDPYIIKNKSKIEACVKNANKFNEIIDKHGSMKSF